MAVVDPGSSPTWTFTYNAVGDRVQWANSGGPAEFLFDPNGVWLGQAGNYSLVPWGAAYLVVYFGSETDFNHINNLSSTTVWTNHAGTAVEDILFDPWGEVWQSWGSGGYSFAQLPYYDTTTDTSITMFRHYSPNLGRWLSPDPMGGDITNPQSLNRYAYVLNNPCSVTDPWGLAPGCGQNPLIGPGSSAAALGPGNLRPGVGGGGQFLAPRAGGHPHWGVDLSAAATSPLYPLLPGTVTKVGQGSGGAGLTVAVYAGGGYTYEYMHLTVAFVAPGDQLTADTLVGMTGTSGNAWDLPASKAHLHLQIMNGSTPIDPFGFMGSPCPKGVTNFRSAASGVVGGGPGAASAWGSGGGGGTSVLVDTGNQCHEEQVCSGIVGGSTTCTNTIVCSN